MGMTKYIIIKKTNDCRDMVTHIGYDGYFETKADADEECNKLNELNDGNSYVVEMTNINLP